MKKFAHSVRFCVNKKILFSRLDSEILSVFSASRKSQGPSRVVEDVRVCLNVSYTVNQMICRAVLPMTHIMYRGAVMANGLGFGLVTERLIKTIGNNQCISVVFSQKRATQIKINMHVLLNMHLSNTDTISKFLVFID